MKNIKEFALSAANRSTAARLAAVVAGLALLLPGAAMAQTNGIIGTETLTIDFETIPGGTPSEGLTINTQFEATTGISFSLNNGAFPVVAEVGPPATAFKGPPSNTGSDNVTSGPDIGQFFLTNDGVISGGVPPDLIISFSKPVSSVRGVVLDVDFDESFVFQARNSQGAVLKTLSLASGDPGTGDGVSTPWELDLGANEIFSVRVVGSRAAVGGFGLGFDNLVAFALIEGIVFDGADLANGSVDFSPVDVREITALDGFSFDNSTFDSETVKLALAKLMEDTKADAFAELVQKEDLISMDTANVTESQSKLIEIAKNFVEGVAGGKTGFLIKAMLGEKTLNDLALEIAKEGVGGLAKKAVPIITLGEMFGNISIVIYEEVQVSIDSAGDTERRGFLYDRILTAESEAREALRERNIDNLSSMNPLARVILREMTRELAVNVLTDIMSTATSIENSSNEQDRAHLATLMTLLENRAPFYLNATAGAFVPGEDGFVVSPN